MTNRAVWKLGRFLRDHNVTPYALGQELERARPDAKRNVGQNLAYRWARATEPPERLYTPALLDVIGALTRLTGRPVHLTDILDVEDAAGGSSVNANQAQQE